MPRNSSGKLELVWALACGSAAAMLGPSRAGAQVEEVVVTAERREESLQDVGVAVTALDGKTLQTLAFDRPLDIAQLTPGLNAVHATSDATPIFAIRGVGLDDFNPNNTSGIAAYVDDIAISSPMMLDGNVFDVDRVEVLKGPQGTLFGRNSTGGAINFISRQPKDGLEGYANVSYGRWNSLDMNAAVSGPISDTVSARIAGDYRRSFTGWQTDYDTGLRYGKPNSLAVRGTLNFRANEALTASLSVHFSNNKSITASPQEQGDAVTLGAVTAGLIDVPGSNPGTVRVSGLSPHRDDNAEGASLKLNYRLTDFHVTSITGFDVYHFIAVDNYDGARGPTFDFFQNDLIRQFYQEIRLTSIRGLLDGRVDWVAGASYAYDRFNGGDSSDQSASFIGQFEQPPDFFTSGLSTAQASYGQWHNSLGLYLNTNIHFTDRLSLVLGGRQSFERVAFDGVSTENGSANGGVLFHGIGATVASLDDVHKLNKFTYRAELTYKILPKVLMYGSVSSGYKSGAYYASPALDPASWGYVAPETLTSYELGVKSRALNDTLQVNAAIYQYDYDDRQSLITFISPVTGVPVASLGSVPKARGRGGELEATVAPTAALQVTAGVSYIDTYITETVTSLRGAPLLTAIPAGSTLTQAPKWQLSVRGQYGFDLAESLRATINADYFWVDVEKASLADPNGYYGPDQGLGGSFEIAQRASGLSLALWGRNLTNNAATTYSFTDFYGGITRYRAQPRSYGVTLGVKF